MKLPAHPKVGVMWRNWFNMKKYDYIIVYTFSAKGYLGPCYGSIQISCKKKLKSFVDIAEVQSQIRKQMKQEIENLLILNIIYLGHNKH